MQGEPLDILLVEDNPDHAGLVMRSFEDHRTANVIHHVHDGDGALDYLFRRGRYNDPRKSPRPNVVLLDLRIPKTDGLEVLRQIKTSELKKIPVVVLTTSDAESDVAKAYEYRANSYLVKPAEFQDFTRMMRDLGFYWLQWNQRPRVQTAF